MSDDHDSEQNRRLRTLEQQVNQLSSDMAALTAQLTTLTSVGKGLAAVCAAAIGIDILPMMGGGV